MRVLVFLLIAVTLNFPAYSLSVSEILAHPSKYDRKKVVISGEVIGEPLRGGEGVWINIKDNTSNIGIFLKDASLIKIIKHFGSYGVEGDTVQVEGTFYATCPIHAERDIHGDKLVVLRQGFIKAEEISRSKERIAFFLAIICLTLSVIYLIKLKYAQRD